MKRNTMQTVFMMVMAALLAGAAPLFAAEKAPETAGELLAREHKLVVVMAGVAEEEAAAMLETGRVDTARIHKMVDFFSVFVDECHHGKEERHLFPTMMAVAPEYATNLRDDLEDEHKRGRELIHTIRVQAEAAAEGDEAAPELLAAHLQEYAAMMRLHVKKENDILFSEVDARLSEKQHRMLLESFRVLEEQEIGMGVHEKYHTMAKQMSGR